VDESKIKGNNLAFCWAGLHKSRLLTLEIQINPVPAPRDLHRKTSLVVIKKQMKASSQKSRIEIGGIDSCYH
jgi:hypothetical protein